VLSALVAKSLVHRTTEGRYDLHELVRQYAATQLQVDAQEYAQIHERHAHYFAMRLQHWEEQLMSPKQPAILAEMNTEIGNLRLAWSWMVAHRHTADIRASLQSLTRFHMIRSRFQEGAGLFGQAVEALQASGEIGAERIADTERRGVLGAVLARQGLFYAFLGRHGQAQTLLQSSLTLLRSHDSKATLADTLYYLGLVKHFHSDYTEAQQSWEESLVLNRALGNGILPDWAQWPAFRAGSISGS
jgi:tetratricopeptide (TPR) repeat protein